MITWMQRHKKWLIITIWISTIAFVGAGFVGWGQYSYGDKAGAVAKVGNIEITQGELQKSYSNLYVQYNKMFQGNFDEEKAKQFGLQKQALNQLTQQALILNLAASYDLSVSDAELIAALKEQRYFFKNGVFDKETYKQVLSQNRLSTKEFEAGLKKDLLIKKTLALLPSEATQKETKVLDTILNIADKINYKVLSQEDIILTPTDDALKAFWEGSKNNYMSDKAYVVKYITQSKLSKTYDDATVANYYNDNKTHFKDGTGKILPLDAAKEAVVQELNTKATKDKALRSYIAFKKGKLPQEITVTTVTLSESNNQFSAEALEKIAALSLTAPYMKPLLVDDVYHTFELIKIIPAAPKKFEEAKDAVVVAYNQEMKKKKLLELANNSLAKFSGENTPFITVEDKKLLTALSEAEANEFLQQLFSSDKKRSYITLANGKIVLYYILEQKLLEKTNSDLKESMTKIKTAMFNEALIKRLQSKYKTEIFIQGL